MVSRQHQRQSDGEIEELVESTITPTSWFSTENEQFQIVTMNKGNFIEPCSLYSDVLRVSLRSVDASPLKEKFWSAAIIGNPQNSPRAPLVLTDAFGESGEKLHTLEKKLDFFSKTGPRMHQKMLTMSASMNSAHQHHIYSRTSSLFWASSWWYGKHIEGMIITFIEILWEGWIELLHGDLMTSRVAINHARVIPELFHDRWSLGSRVLEKFESSGTSFPVAEGNNTCYSTQRVS